MTSKNRSFRPSPAMIVACVALLLALTGSAIAAGVAKNSVRSAQIVDGTVRTLDLRDSAVSSTKVADDSLTAADLAPDSVGTSEIAENAVSSPEVAPDSLTAGDLGANSVASSEVTDQSLTANDLGQRGPRQRARRDHHGFEHRHDRGRQKRQRRHDLPRWDGADQRRRPRRLLPSRSLRLLPQRQRLARRCTQRSRRRHHAHGLRQLPGRLIARAMGNEKAGGFSPRPFCMIRNLKWSLTTHF
jgi:hypothetical protein